MIQWSNDPMRDFYSDRDKDIDRVRDRYIDKDRERKGYSYGGHYLRGKGLRNSYKDPCKKLWLIRIGNMKQELLISNITINRWIIDTNLYSTKL